MSDDDNYSWLDEYSSDPSAKPDNGVPDPAARTPTTPMPSTPASPPTGAAPPPMNTTGTPAPPPTGAAPPPMNTTGTPAPPPTGAAPPPMNTTSTPAPPPMSSRGRGGRDPLAEKLLQGQPPRQQGRWQRFSTRDRLKLAAVVVALVSAFVYVNFIGPDTSSIGGLDVGDCFEAPDGRVKRVTMQDCALPHEGQVIAEANGLQRESQQKCVEAIDALDPLRVAALPDDASFVVFNATISHRCVVISPSGQITQLLTGP